MAKKPFDDWFDFEQRFLKLCGRLGMTHIDPSDVLCLAAVGLALAMKEPEFKVSGRGRKLAIQTNDLRIVAHAIDQAIAGGQDEKKKRFVV
ncbi:MAG: hypothetical protein GEU95_02560 [Rhizobiales bacterium]|nr:hypothetical protein [Hyphomicrobiales bacterium]